MVEQTAYHQALALAMLTKVFQGVDSEIIQTLYHCAEIQSYPENTKLIAEGAFTTTFYILLAGQADIYEFHEGDHHRIDILRPGQSFGELALILDVPRTADIVTTEPVTVLELDRDDFERYILNHTPALMAIVRLALHRTLHQIDRKISEAARRKRQHSAKPEIFISYARTEEEFARKLASDLIKEKFNVWLDLFHLDSGISWARQIGEALDSCQVMLLILTPNSIASENVEDEWNYYLDKHKQVIPILLHDCNIPYRLHKLQYVDFIRTPYSSAFSHVVSDLTAILT